MKRISTYHGTPDALFELMNQAASMDGVRLIRWSEERHFVRLKRIWHRSRRHIWLLVKKLPAPDLRTVVTLRSWCGKALVALGLRRPGQFGKYDGSWERSWEIDGTYQIQESAITFTVNRNRGDLTDEQITKILDRLTENWMMRPLKDLEESHESLRRRLQRTESSREVYVAIWKSFPYITISLVTALLTTYLYLGINEPAEAIGGIVGLSLVLGLGVGAWWKSREKDNHAASLRILSDRVGSLAGERIALMAGDLRRLKDRLPMVDAPMRGRPFHDYINQVKSKNGPLRDHIKDDRLRDIASKLPALAEAIEELYEKRDKFVFHVGEFRQLAIKKTSGIKDSELSGSEDREYLFLALFLVCSGKIPTNADTMSEEPRNFGENRYIEKFLSDDRVYREIAEDPGLIEYATGTSWVLDQAIQLRSDVATTIEYHFGRP